MISSPTNVLVDPVDLLANPIIKDSTHEIPLTFTSWRTNVNFNGAIMVTADLPPTLMGDYHLAVVGSPAFNLGASVKSSIPAPTFDIDNQGRPAKGGYDSGADEIPITADLQITKTDGKTSVLRGEQIRYTIVVSNPAGPDPVTNVTIADSFSSVTGLSGTINWTCTTSGGATCGGSSSGSGNISRTTVSIPVGGTVTFNTTSGSVSTSASAGSLINTATVSSGAVDPNPSNNSATDSDTIVSMHISNLAPTPAAVLTGTNTWTANVTITVVNSNGAAVSGATVSGSWLGGSGSGSGGTSCSTNASGQCTVTRTGINRSRTSQTFTVSNIVSAAYPYQASDNVVTSITVAKP